MWSEQERGIVTIAVRGEEKKLDPMPMWRRYQAGIKRVGPEAFKNGLNMMLTGEDSPDVASLCMPVITETFGWKTFTEDSANGYTETELLVAFTQFLDWVVESKKKDENSPSSAGSDGASDATPPTSSTLPSSSAEELSNPDDPGKSPTA